MDGAAFIGADAFAGETDLEKKQWSVLVVRIVLYYVHTLRENLREIHFFV